MWFRIRHLLYILLFVWIGVGAWNLAMSRRLPEPRAWAAYLEEAAPGIVLGVAPMERSWKNTIVHPFSSIEGPSREELERRKLQRDLWARKKQLEKERKDREIAEGQQKVRMEERERRIDELERQMALLREPKTDWIAFGSNGIASFCALIGLWLGWLTYRGPSKSKGPPRLPRGQRLGNLGR